MKAKFTFEYDTIEDSEEIKTMLVATDMSIALDNIQNHLRHILKHEDHSEEIYDIVEKIQTFVSEEVCDIKYLD